MTRSQKKIVLLVAIIVLIAVITTPLTRISAIHFSYNEPLGETEILSVQEINDFMKVWSEFVREGYYQEMKQVSLNHNSKVPASIIRWLELEGWNTSRFFAVEQRLRFLVSVASLKNDLEANIGLQKTSQGANITNIIENQKQKLSSLKYNSQELALVKENLYQISSVLDGKAVVE